MAKEKNQPKNTDQQMDQKMVDKVNKTLSEKDDTLFSRMVGIGLIIFGVLLVVLAVVLVVIALRDPKEVDNIKTPSVEVDRYTNESMVTISGESPDGGKIMVWVDDELQKNQIKVGKDGNYESELDLKDEGEYEVAVATVKGFIFKTRSERSEPVKVTVDMTAPSSDVELSYDSEVENGVVSISGQAKEGNVKVTLQGAKKYEVTSDKDGKFEFLNLSLKDGINEYKVTIEDRAGNKKTLARKIVVTSSVADNGDINGDGINDGGSEIPEASGELDAAMRALMANKVMVAFGTIALAVFVINSAIVAKKLKAQA